MTRLSCESIVQCLALQRFPNTGIGTNSINIKRVTRVIIIILHHLCVASGLIAGVVLNFVSGPELNFAFHADLGHNTEARLLFSTVFKEVFQRVNAKGCKTKQKG